MLSGLCSAVYSAFSPHWDCLCKIWVKDEASSSCILKSLQQCPIREVLLSQPGCGLCPGPLCSPLAHHSKGVKQGLCLARLKAKVAVPKMDLLGAAETLQLFKGTSLHSFQELGQYFWGFQAAQLCLDLYLCWRCVCHFCVCSFTWITAPLLRRAYKYLGRSCLFIPICNYVKLPYSVLSHCSLNGLHRCFSCGSSAVLPGCLL